MRTFRTFLISICLSDKPTSSRNMASNEQPFESDGDHALQLAKAKKFTESEMIVDNIMQMLQDSPSFSGEEIRILQVSYNEIKRTFESDNFSDEEAIRNLTKFRLAVDALLTEHEPLWTDMEDSVITAFESVKDAVIHNDKENIHKEWDVFLSVYDIIYPSIVLDVDYEKIQKVDVQIQYLQQASGEAGTATILWLLRHCAD